MQSKFEAVREIAKTATTLVVKNAAEQAFQEGSLQALDRAIQVTKQHGQTLHVINIANKQLGYPSNHTD